MEILETIFAAIVGIAGGAAIGTGLGKLVVWLIDKAQERKEKKRQDKITLLEEEITGLKEENEVLLRKLKNTREFSNINLKSLINVDSKYNQAQIEIGYLKDKVNYLEKQLEEEKKHSSQVGSKWRAKLEQERAKNNEEH